MTIYGRPGELPAAGDAGQAIGPIHGGRDRPAHRLALLRARGVDIIVGAEEDADTAVGAQVEKDIMDLAPAAGVEPVGRLIEYQQLWDADERPCER